METALARPRLMGAWALSWAVLFAGCRGTPAPMPAELELLQGYWEGEGAGGKCSITITGDLLLYRVGTNWHKATITLPSGSDPRQLHATLVDSLPPIKDAVGKVIFALYKIEDGTLTLAVGGNEPPKTFDDATATYVVKRVAEPAGC